MSLLQRFALAAILRAALDARAAAGPGDDDDDDEVPIGDPDDDDDFDDEEEEDDDDTLWASPRFVAAPAAVASDAR